MPVTSRPPSALRTPAGRCSSHLENLTDKQTATHRELQRAGGDAWRAYTLKEALRATFLAGLSLDDVTA